MKVYIDNLGRILIPKFIRHELHIGANDELEMRVQDNKIILDPGNRYLCSSCERNLLNTWDNYCSYCGCERVKIEVETEKI